MLTSTLRRFAAGGSIPMTAGVMLLVACLPPSTATQQNPSAPPPPPPVTASAPATAGAIPISNRGAFVVSGGAIAGRTRLSDVVAGIAGLRVVRTSSGESIVMSGRMPGCMPELFLDRLRVSGAGGIPFDIDLIPVSTVERIEVYQHASAIALDVPLRNARCGAVIIRTVLR